jgi:hypothetical protein
VRSHKQKLTKISHSLGRADHSFGCADHPPAHRHHFAYASPAARRGRQIGREPRRQARWLVRAGARVLGLKFLHRRCSASLKADAASPSTRRDAGRAGSVLNTERHDVPSGGSAMFVAASSLQNARSMHSASGTAMHGNALRMLLPADHCTVPASATGQIPCGST